MNQSKGFSLVELSVALFIIALLLGGALIPLSTQVDVRNTAETRRNLDSIREAIIGFTQANGRLPCPASGTVAAGTAGAGIEALTFAAPNTICTNPFGVVPWTTLGVPETDSWGRRFSYWVSPIFADGLGTATYNNPFPTALGQSPACPLTPPLTPIPTQSSFALCSLGNLAVNTRNENNHVATAIGLALPAVIISHGKNGKGAYTPAGSTLAAPTGADELANATHTIGPAGVTTFYSRTPTTSTSPCSDAGPGAFCEFDDIVVMISSNVLMSRMIAAGKLP
jgi:prepilin-type N-terminal cleavage/methylation domain-containing protein